MRLKLIIPTTNKDLLARNRQLRQDATGGLVSLDVVGLEQGPSSIETAYDCALATLPLVDAARRAEADGYSGIAIDCAADPGLRAVKEAVSIPVVGAGEASYLLAMTLCSKFSVIAVLRPTAILIGENIRKYGFGERLCESSCL